MSFSASYNPAMNAVETNFRGIVNQQEIQAAMLYSHTLAAERGTAYFLVDLTDTDIRLSIIDIYNLPEAYERIGRTRPVRIALLSPSNQNKECIDFCKLVSQNRGWNIETFSDSRQARNWLLS
ncbi:MAG: hypothetical protein AAGA83_02160 [Cyanobacteria bacterium P01_F01_bin.116]